LKPQVANPAAEAPFLLIDSGNTRVKWALADQNGALHGVGLLQHGLDTAGGWPEWPPEQASGTPEQTGDTPRSIWISNVAGEAAAQRLAARLEARWPGLPRHTIATQATQCGVVNGYQTPTQLGSDRWAGLLAARAAYPDEHVLIATCGTATTLEALRADGVFCGGLLAPGWTLMMQALGQHTAQLPTLSTEQARELLHRTTPANATDDAGFAGFAQDTQASISQGCLLAQAGLIERAWRSWAEFLGAPVRLVLSGGAAEAVEQALHTACTRHDHLVLAGLGLIAADHLHSARDSGTVAMGSAPHPILGS